MARKNDDLELVEEMLIDAWRMLGRLPDKSRRWLGDPQGNWPQVIRDLRAGDYGDPDAAPLAPLSRDDLALVGRVFLDSPCLVQMIPAANQRLFAAVLAHKARRGGGGFDWSEVWEEMGGRRSGLTSDACRKRYERGLAVIGGAMGAGDGY